MSGYKSDPLTTGHAHIQKFAPHTHTHSPLTIHSKTRPTHSFSFTIHHTHSKTRPHTHTHHTLKNSPHTLILTHYSSHTHICIFS